MNSRLHKEVTELATEGELKEQLSPSPGSTVLMAHSLLPSRGSSAIIAKVKKGTQAKLAENSSPHSRTKKTAHHLVSQL